MKLNRRRFHRLLLPVLLPASLTGMAGRAAEGPGSGQDTQGKVILTVTGRIRKPTSGTRAEFDMAALEKLPQHSFTTRTPWHDQPRKFTGPRLRDLLEAVGAEGKTLRAIALNDYRVDIPVEDATKYEVIVARLMDDRPMPVRDKGPLFIIYPFDTRSELQNALYYGRSAWQLKAIEVL